MRSCASTPGNSRVKASSSLDSISSNLRRF
jgi:hypothetical protein